VPDENSHFIDTDPVKPHFMTSTPAFRAQVSTSPSQMRPSTPAPPDLNVSKPSGWVTSAGKRLGFTTPKSKKNEIMTTKNVSVSAAAKPQRKSLRVSPPNVTNSEKLRRSILQQGSPSDKPLPSLPIATSVTKSPVHPRSLIDATEKPLRRSASSSPGFQAVVDWPALSPLQPTSSLLAQQSMSSTADKDWISVPQNEHEKIDKDASRPMQKNEVSNMWAVEDYAIDVLPSRSSLIDTPAMTSTNETLSHNHNSISMSEDRETKTSLMRAHLSADGGSPIDNGRRITPLLSQLTIHDIGHYSSFRDSVSQTSQLSRLGPIRSHPNSRRMVTSQGSPYSTGIRSQTKLTNIKKRGRLGGQHIAQNKSRSILAGSNHSRLSSKALAIGNVCFVDNSDQRSSIPLPRRLIRNLAHGEIEGEVSITKPGNKQKSDAGNKSDDGDLDTEVDNNSARVEILEVPVASSAIRKTTHEVTEITATNTSDQSDLQTCSGEDSDSEIGSRQSFGDFEPAGYRLRRLPITAPKHGPILRISDAADSAIFGVPEIRDITQISRNDSRSSRAPDLRRSLILKEVIRKPECVKTHMLTNQSLSKETVGDDGQDASVQEFSTSGHSGHDGSYVMSNTVIEPRTTHIYERGTLYLENCTLAPSPVKVADPGAVLTPYCAIVEEDKWPLKGEKSLPTELDIVHEIPGEDASRISPLAKYGWTHNTSDDETATTPETLAPLSTPVSNYSKPIKRQVSVLANNSALLIDRRDSPVEGSHNTGATVPIPTSDFVHPPRTSSRTQGSTWNTNTNVNPGNLCRSVTQKPPIPNCFVSPISSSQGKDGIPFHCTKSSRNTPIPSFDNKLGNLSTTNSHEHVPFITQMLTTEPISGSKSVLSNFRDLFHKRSAESDILSSSRTSPRSLRRKRVKVSKVSKVSSPFSSISSPLSITAGEVAQNTKGIVRSTPNSKELWTDPPGVGGRGVDEQAETDEMQKATRLAFDMLDLAKSETETATKGILVDVGFDAPLSTTFPFPLPSFHPSVCDVLLLTCYSRLAR
jgi:hypothetical protein